MKLETTPPLNVVLVDDCDLATAGLRAILEAYDDRVHLVDIREALAQPTLLDVILYEPMGLSGMASSVLRDLQSASDAHTAVFSWVDRDQLPTPTARPCLRKRSTASQLVVALEDLVAGRLTGPPAADVTLPQPVEVVEEVVRPSVSKEVRVGVDLTPREVDVIALITTGRSNLEISSHLGLSVNSVKTYIRTAYRKIGAERRSQAVLWGVSHGLDGDDQHAVTA